MQFDSLVFRSHSLRIIGFVSATLCVSGPVLAASGTWANNTGNADANWDTLDNWVSIASVPGGTDLAANNTDVATFASAASVETPVVNQSRRLARLAVDNTLADYNIGVSGGSHLFLQNAGAQLTFTGGGTSIISPQLRSFSSTITWGLGTTDLTLAGGFAVTSAAPSLTPTNSIPVTISGTVTNAGTVASNLKLIGTGSLNITGDIVHGAGAATMTMSSDGGTSSYFGTLRLSGNNNFTVTNFRTGTMDIASDTALNGGTMSVGTGTASSGALSVVISGAYTASRGISSFTGSGNSSVELGGTNTSGVATWSGGIDITSRVGGINVTAASGGVVDFTGIVAGSSEGFMNKIGLGTVRLTRANTHQGTTVSAGTLLANNTTGSATGDVASVAVNVNNTGTFGGTGSTGTGASYSAVNVNAGGTLSPGDSTLAANARAGTLAIGSLTFNGAGAAFTVDLNGATAGDGVGFYDQALVTGVVTLTTDANFSGTVGYTPAMDQIFTLIANDGIDVVAGTGLFNLNGSNLLTQGEVFVLGSTTFQISYASGGTGATFLAGGNDIAIQVVPEPASLCLLALGGLAVLRRQRRR